MLEHRILPSSEVRKTGLFCFLLRAIEFNCQGRSWTAPGKLSARPVFPCLLGKCMVCSLQEPCLFNLIADEGERVNLASKEPTIVRMQNEREFVRLSRYDYKLHHMTWLCC